MCKVTAGGQFQQQHDSSMTAASQRSEDAAQGKLCQSLPPVLCRPLRAALIRPLALVMKVTLLKLELTYHISYLTITLLS